MFIDIQGCSEISNRLDLEEYNDFLEEFRQCVEDVYQEILKKYETEILKSKAEKFILHNTQGDEASFIGLTELCFKDAQDKDAQEKASVFESSFFLDIAVSLKLKWLMSKTNLARIKIKKMPTDLAIGINYGPVIVNQPTPRQNELRPEGYTINLGKRIEGESREGLYSQIFVSQGVKNNWEVRGYDELEIVFDAPRMKMFKGISQPQPIYEVKFITVPTSWYNDLKYVLGIASSDKTSKTLIDTLEQVSDLNPGNLWFTINLARQHLLQLEPNNAKKKNKNEQILEKAEKLFASCYQYTQDDSYIDFLIGLVYGEQEFYFNELRCYTNGLKKSKHYAEGYYYRGVCYSYILEENGKPRSKLGSEPSERFKQIDELKGKSELDILLLCISDFAQAIKYRDKFSWAYYEIAGMLNIYKDNLKKIEGFVKEKDKSLYVFLEKFGFDPQKLFDKSKELNPNIINSSENNNYLKGLKIS